MNKQPEKWPEANLFAVFLAGQFAFPMVRMVCLSPESAGPAAQIAKDAHGGLGESLNCRTEKL